VAKKTKKTEEDDDLELTDLEFALIQEALIGYKQYLESDRVPTVYNRAIAKQFLALYVKFTDFLHANGKGDADLWEVGIE
jgi:hypothetical protein